MPVAAAESLRAQTHRRMTLLATDEFWFAPALVDAVPPSASGKSARSDSDRAVVGVGILDQEDGGDDHSEDDCMPMLSMPPAHRQLLSDEPAACECLKGRDHTAVDAFSRSIPDGYITSVSDSEDDDDEPSSCKEKLSDVKQRGGGSWLLGFTRLNVNDRPTSDVVPPCECEGADAGSDDDVPPGLVRESDDSSLDSDGSSSSDTASLGCDDDDASVPEAPPAPARRRGVTFLESVSVQPVPHSSSLSPLQRRRMYTASTEVRRNKARAKVEWRYDGCDWRNVTEEWEMGVDMATGELVHPAHEA